MNETEQTLQEMTTQTEALKATNERVSEALEALKIANARLLALLEKADSSADAALFTDFSFKKVSNESDMAR